MYRATKKQPSLFQSAFALPPPARARLEASWAPKFETKVFPLLLAAEGSFSDLYDPENGRPNWSVARILGLMLLQEMHGLSDQAALDQLAYDVRWQRALGVNVADAYLSRRSLVHFRSSLIKIDPEGVRLRKLFDVLVAVITGQLGMSMREVRLDSTFVRSNIFIRGRLDLFVQTLGRFCRTLAKEFPTHFARLPAEIQEASTADEDGTFGGLTAEDARERIKDVAKWLLTARDLFDGDAEIVALEAFQLVNRLIAEQIRIKPAPVPVPAQSTTSDGSMRTPGSEPDPSEPGSAPPGSSSAPPGSSSAPPGSRPEPSKPAASGPPSPEAAPAMHESSKSSVHGSESTTPPDTALAGGGAEVTSGVSAETVTTPPPSPESTVELVRPEDPGKALQSPHDPDAGYGHKGAGYHVQIAEACRTQGARLIIDFEVHPAFVSDHGQAEACLQRLETRGIAPENLYVDAGYVSGSALLAFEEKGVGLHGPVRWGSLKKDSILRTEWERHPETKCLYRCPAGHAVVRHDQRMIERTPRLCAYLDGAKCRECPLKSRCLARPSNNRGTGAFFIEDTTTIARRDQRLVEQQQPEWRKKYAIRSGVESTNSELKRVHRLGSLRVRRAPRVRLAVTAKLIACNVKRWLQALK